MMNHEAAPQYQNYLRRMRQEGKKPLDRKQWERKVLHTGPVNQQKFQRTNYHPAVKDVMEKHDLTDRDADQVEEFHEIPRRGKKWTDEQRYAEFLKWAKPETRERMKGVGVQDFMQMYNAIMSKEDEGEAPRMASLRDAVIKLAHANPELRKHLVPLLREGK
jgi:hypothetical protein